MNQFGEEEVIPEDYEDLIEILKMRFGSVPPKMLESIHQLTDYGTISRLILVAANSPTLKVFKEELEQGEGSFRLVGDRFNPIEGMGESGDSHG